MRILFCNYEYPPLGGGGGVVMAALARHLARRHDVTVLTSRAAGLSASDDDQGVRVLRVPVFFRRELAVANFPSMLAYLPSGLMEGLRRRHGRFDVINTHFAVPSGPLGQVLSRIHGVPNVLSVHGGDLFDPSKASSPHRHAVLRAAVRSMLRSADAIVGQSQDTVRHVQSLYGVQRQVELIPLGIDRPESVTPSPRAAFGVPDDAFTLITIGRLVARKATEQLLELLRHPHLENAHLIVVGDGPEAADLQRRAADPAIHSRVHWLGNASEKVKLAALSISDAFISASQHEGFGLVFLEAMAAGLPVVCYDRGGQVDFLATGQTGHLVHLNDREGLARAAVALRDNAAERAAMGVSNRARVEQYFIDTCAARYEALFERVIDRRSHARASQVGAASST